MEDNATSATRLLDAISTTTASSNLPTLLADNISSLGLWDDNDTDGSIGMNNRSNGSFRGVAGNNTFLMAQIPFYILIFLLSVVGNILVIVTVIQNKKMRSLTNVFLLNLSVSDLLLSVFCMPFTLIPIYLKDFIFGEAMCIMVRYLQGVSVATSCFTLVAISLERYFAICHPLKSRRWQTLSHSYKAIALCWVCSLALSVPIAIHHVYKEILQTGRHACREVWPSVESEQAYTISLNLFLLALPILIMTWAYGCVSYTLWIGMKLEKKTEKDIQCKNGSANYDAQNGVSIYVNNKKVPQQRSGRGGGLYNCSSDTTSSLINSSATNKSNQSLKSSTEPIVASKPFRRFDAHRAMRQSNTERSRAAKKRVIKMLFIIVLEFFIFWTPSYVIYTWFVFDPKHARQHLTLEIKSLFHLLSYVSTCCNPITYCFMNKNFRDSFLMAFRCSKKRYVYANRSQMSMNSGMTNSTRAPVSQAATSYDKIIDSDDISENSF